MERKARKLRSSADLSAEANEGLRSFAETRRLPDVNVDAAIAEVLYSITGKRPERLFESTFSSKAVGLDDAQMPQFLATLALLFDSRLAGRILHEIAPLARQRIGLLRDLIRLWQNEGGK